MTTTSAGSTTTSGSGGNGGDMGSSSVSTGSGIGTPSDVYPAPHPKAPNVVSLFGPVLHSPKAVPVLFNGDAANMKAGIQDFLNIVGTTTYWTATTEEYGVGPATATPAVILDEVPAGNITDDQIQQWLGAKLNANDPAFPAPDANTVYMIFYPAGTTISLQGDQSCSSFGGYHSNFELDAAHGNMPVAYAVMPRCGNFGGLGGLDAVTGTASHELIEATTDPYPQTDPAFGQIDNQHIYWEFGLGGGENADMCAQFDDVFTTFPPELSYIAQRSWSNKSANAGHDPCVPAPANQVYFNAAPVLTDNISLAGVTMKGVKIPVGGTKTIDVALFSDGPTNGPFNVDAFDASAIQGGSSSLDLSFDESAGQNGQTLHLTITVTKASPYNAEIFFLVSQHQGRQNMWLGLVGN